MSRPGRLIRDGLIDGQYRLERQLGRGGMGTVWAAEDLRLGRPVAIKFLASELAHDAQARLRFAREPRLASKIRSPHVVQVFAEGTTQDGIPYLVMELLEGEDLSTRIATGGPIGLVEAGSIVEQLVRGLGRAHREGLIHRDIKPHNIFLTSESDGGVFVKLLDFGIAKDVGTGAASLTMTGEVVGSALYVSPEQLHEAQSVGPSTDLWALAVVIYEMLSGKTPFEGDTLPELFMRIVHCRYTPISARGLGLPPSLDAFFARTFVLDRARRHQTAAELGAAFSQIVRANASGLLVRSEADAAVSSAERTPAPANVPPVKPLAEEPPTERLPKRWPLRMRVAAAMLVCAVAALVAVVFLRRAEVERAAPVRAAASESDVPVPILRPAPVPTATAPNAPIEPAPPAATTVTPPVVSPTALPKPPTLKPKPSAKQAPASSPTPHYKQQQNYGF